MKNILLKSLLVFIFFSLGSIVNAATIEKIMPIDNGNIKFITSYDIKLPKENLEADIKVLKDLLVSHAYKDAGNPKKVTLNLTYDLHKNNTYNLLGVIGSDANADFTVGEEIPAEIVVKENKDVEKVKVVDSKTLEIFYKQELSADEFVYKVLRDLGTEAKVGKELGTIDLKIKSPLESFSSYILLINSFKDAEGKNVKFDDVYYEFETGKDLKKVVEPEKLELASAPIQEPKKEEKGNIKEVAKKATKTPDTGAATWILLLGTFGITGFLFVRNKLTATK